MIPATAAAVAWGTYLVIASGHTHLAALTLTLATAAYLMRKYN